MANSDDPNFDLFIMHRKLNTLFLSAIDLYNLKEEVTETQQEDNILQNINDGEQEICTRPCTTTPPTTGSMTRPRVAYCLLLLFNF